MQHEDEYFCPSFSTYSSNKIAEIATKISDEIKLDDSMVSKQAEEKVKVNTTDDVEDFEFIYNYQIQPVFPVFNRDLLQHDVSNNVESPNNMNNSIQVSLRDLFIEEGEAQSSSSEVDELEHVNPVTYCIWKPKLTTTDDHEPSPNRCKKSNSTGSMFKRWNIRDLMRRSNSEGKDSFVFLTPRNTGSSKKVAEETVGKAVEKVKAKRNGNGGEKASSSSSSTAMYHKNKRKSYLPYRQDLLGFFTNVNSFTRTFPPF